MSFHNAALSNFSLFQMLNYLASRRKIRIQKTLDFIFNGKHEPFGVKKTSFHPTSSKSNSFIHSFTIGSGEVSAGKRKEHKL